MLKPEILEKYIDNMKVWGEKHFQIYTHPDSTFDDKLAAYYYDIGRVYNEIEIFLSDASWAEKSHVASEFYLKEYVLPNNGKVPGYWNFSDGLRIQHDDVYTEFSATTNREFKEGIEDLSLRAAYAPATTPIRETIPSTMSREVAYNIMTSLNAEHVGLKKAEHYKWFVSETAPYIRPFMVALSAEALIRNYKDTPLKCIPTLKLAADKMWNDMWLPNSEAFMYTNVDTPEGGTEPAPDLNLLICPLYAYIFKHTKDRIYLDRADAIFEGGVKQAYLGSPKQFNQNYRWSFDYLRWRKNAEPSNAYEVEYPPGTLECSNYFLKQIRDLLKNIDKELPTYSLVDGMDNVIRDIQK